jgi:RNA polymerase sigma factor (sigma-70 family)
LSDDTQIGGPSGRFPATRWSAILAARSADGQERKRALEVIVSGYWKPVYKHIRLRWNQSNEDAKDLTQEFFARLIDKDLLADYQPEKARLQTFLRTCVDGFVANEEKAARRQKRGGHILHVPLDVEGAEQELACANIWAPGTVEEFFEKEWVRSLFGLALEKLRNECEERDKMTHFRLFEMYDLEDAGERQLSYDQLARDFGIAVSDVTNYLAFARREFRRHALDTLREMTATEDEFRREARALLGVELE